MRDVTQANWIWNKRGEFLLTRPMRDVTIPPSPLSALPIPISTHTSHAGRDRNI